MDMNKIAWSIKGKWYTVKQTAIQMKNFIIDQSLTPKGHAAYDYYCKVIFDGSIAVLFHYRAAYTSSNASVHFNKAFMYLS